MDGVNPITDETMDEIFRRFGVEGKSTMQKKEATADIKAADSKERNYALLRIEEVEIKALKPHPRNEEIYGSNEDVSDLVALIRDSGEVDKLIINHKYVIISGHRRWLAAQKLVEDGLVGFNVLLCEIREYISSTAELEALITANVGRDKTNEQKTREGMELEKIISARSIERKKSTLKQNQTDMGEMPTSDPVPTDEESGATRDIVARAVKISSGTKYQRSKAVVAQADEYKISGRSIDSDVLTAILNKSPSAAHEFLVVDIDALTLEDKNSLIGGKVKPRKFIPPKVKKFATKDANSVYGMADKQIGSIENATKELKKLALVEVNEKEVKKIQSRLEKQIAMLQRLLPKERVPTVKPDNETAS